MPHYTRPVGARPPHGPHWRTHRGATLNVIPEGDGPARWHTALFLGAALFTLTPFATPGLALGLGVALALLVGNPFARKTAVAAKWLLQASVVGLGFGIALGALADAGRSGIAITMAGIATTLALGIALGRWLRVERATSLLLAVGTAICGGSAIAAVGPVIGASAQAMSVSLATVFLLNAAALYLFPAIGALLDMTPAQFALWAAIAIHDTSSVVGAAVAYDARSVEPATVLKLARALWIAPIALAAAALHARGKLGLPHDTGERRRVSVPWFILLFVLAAIVRTMSPPGMEPVYDGIARIARVTLVLTLFLIGTNLTRGAVRSVGARAFVAGAVLWALVGTLALVVALRA